VIHEPTLTRPTYTTVQYRCSCGWVGTVVESVDLGKAGAELVRHVKEQSGGTE